MRKLPSSRWQMTSRSALSPVHSTMPQVSYDDCGLGGLSFSRDKQQTWSMSVMQLPEPFQMCRVDQLRCLGNTLQQIDGDSEPALPQIGADLAGGGLRLASQMISALADSIVKLVEHGLPRQIGQNLFRYAATGQTQHIISARRIPQSAAHAYDTCLCAAWARS